MSKNPKGLPGTPVFHGLVAPCPAHPGSVHIKCVHPMEERCSESGYGGGEVVYEGQGASGKISSGVNSEAFRTGWERVFGGGTDTAN
jgi:hypothetical protein